MKPWLCIATAAFLAAASSFAASSSFAQGTGAAKSDDRVLVYVDDVVPADKSLAADATALTTALCAAIGKDKRFDVLCAPDVKQILSFAATAAMVGTTGGPGGAVQDRLDRTKHVVSASFKKDGSNYVMVVKAGPKYEFLAKNPVGETIMATPAISDGLLIVRTVSHPFAFGEAPVSKK